MKNVDPIVQMVQAYKFPKRNVLQGMFINYLSGKGLMDVIDMDRVAEAVKKEIRYLNDKIVVQIRNVPGHESDSLLSGLANQEPDQESSSVFSHNAIDALRQLDINDQVAIELAHIESLYRGLKHRVTYLLDPTVTLRDIDKLDSWKDRYQLACLFMAMFKIHRKFTFSEGILAITTNDSLSTFFHSTRQAAEQPLKRQIDTAKHYYYFIEWGGVDSHHGSESVRSMNKIHGRYFVHNDAMKLVLEVCALYESNAIMNLGQPVPQKLLEAYFNVFADMGKEMGIEGLSPDYQTAKKELMDKLENSDEHTQYKERFYWATRKSLYDELGFSPVERKVFNIIGNLAKFDPHRRAVGQKDATTFERFIGTGYLKLMSGMYRKVYQQAHFSSLEKTIRGDAPTIQELGPHRNSIPMSSGCPFFHKENKGMPTDQTPIFSVEESKSVTLEEIPMEEVMTHNTIDDLWVVIDKEVYDLSSFAEHHPGGQRVLLGLVGKDGKKLYDNAKHSDYTRIFALNYRIGSLKPTSNEARA